MDPGLLFVYGTLRDDAPVRAPSSMTAGWMLEGSGFVRGELYDFGPHPGAVPSEDPSARIRGQVYRLPHADESLHRLDVYEGCGPDDAPPHLFERARVTVHLDGGEEMDAWIYWYRGPRRGTRVPSGDWASPSR